MARSVVSYDKDLPEIPDRAPHLEPDSYLRKKAGSVDEFEIVEGRPSSILLPPIMILKSRLHCFLKAQHPACRDKS